MSELPRSPLRCARRYIVTKPRKTPGTVRRCPSFRGWREALSDQVKVLLALDSGLRRSEVLTLHAADLDLDAAWGRVRRALSRAELGPGKTRQARRRPFSLSDQTIAAVRRLDAQQAEEALRRGRALPPMLFPARSARATDSGYEGEDRFGARFLRHLEAAGIVAADRPFHRLRHTF